MKVLPLLYIIETACLLLGADTSKHEPCKPILKKVTATELINAYRTNDAFADENFTKKKVEVTGRVQQILGCSYTSPAHYQVRMFDDRDPNTFIMFTFFDVERKQLIGLKPPRQIVTVSGVCAGRRGEQDKSFIVDFDQCQIISAAEPNPARITEKKLREEVNELREGLRRLEKRMSEVEGKSRISSQ